MKNSIKFTISFLCFLSIITLMGCTWYLTRKNEDNHESSLVSTKKSSWQINTIKNGATGIQNKFFLNAEVGFANKYNDWITNFYKTNDGGYSWKPLGQTSGVYIKGMHFISENEGFAIASRVKPSTNPAENGSNILTTQDSGQNWKSIYFAELTTFNKIIFNSDGIGVAIGRKSFPTQSDATYSMITTRDNGQKWEDMSDKLNNIVVDANNQVSDVLTDVIFTEGCVLTLSGKGNIFQSCNRGESWKLISAISDERMQTGFWRVGVLENGNYWVGGGSSYTMEGTLGVIAVSNKFGWNKYKLEGYYFSDIIFLSNNEVLACGGTLSNSGGKSETGVVLFSSDSGLSWEVILESQDVKLFKSIQKVTSNKVIVFDDNGDGVSLSKCF